MEDELLKVLETFKYPIYQQGSMSNNDEYAPTFITFWNNSSDDLATYDNDDHGTAWAYTVNVYSDDPSVKVSLMDSIRTALKAAGWIPQSRGYDISSDEPTHTGRGLDVIYPEWRTRDENL